MEHATISKSAALIALLVFLGLGVIEPIWHAEAAAPARPLNQADPQSQSQVTPPEPAALVRTYESSLSAYGRMRGRWTVQLETSKRDEAEKLAKSTAEWTVFRDHGRLRLIETMIVGNGQRVFDSFRLGTQLISVYPDGVVRGWLHPTAQDEVRQLSFALCSPCYGIIDGKWIPEFLRMAKLSVSAETLDGRPLYRLRGLTMEAKIEVWIDPSLDHAARRIRFDKRATDGDSTVRSRQFDATQFRLEKGHFVVAEATTTLAVGPQPVLSPFVVEKNVNGKLVRSPLQAARDKDGQVIMSQKRNTWTIKLRDIDFDPKWIDHDFQFARPIANGTKIEVQDAPDSNYVWKDGRIDLIAPDRVRK
jgi:hypothetical protein